MTIEQKNPAGATGRPAIELIGVSKAFDGASGQLAVDDMNLTIAAGEFFTFLGPSGCGKTTTLRMVAGFETPTKGKILLQGQDVSDLPAHLRNVNTVFQSYALFPHLNVEDNVAFGLAVKRVPRRDRGDRVCAALDLVRMRHAARRKPSELSGGQQQRVALARALVNEPSVLLLDEPFGALDLKLRREMQLEVKEMQRRLGITFVFVTHDQEEALTMSDRIAVMSAGLVRQVDDPIGIYERPADRFTAGFIGDMNMLTATVSGKRDGLFEVEAGGAAFSLRADGTFDVDQSCTLAVRPEALSFASAAGSAATCFAGSVAGTVYIGTDRLYAVRLASGETITVRARNADGADTVAIGQPVTVSCPSAAIHLLKD